MSQVQDRSAQAEPIDWLPIAATIAMMGVFAITLGLTYPLLSLVLEAQGVGAGMIGLNAAMTPLGIIVSAPFIPGIAKRFGAWNLSIVFTVSAAVIMLLLGATRSLEAWFLLRFLLGVFVDGLFIVSETWINQLAKPHNRGRIMGAYTTVLAAGFAVGPFVIAEIGSSGWTPFLVGAAAPLLILVLLLPVRRRVPAFDREEHASIRAFARAAPLLLVAVGIMALFDSAVLALMPVYGLRVGLEEATAALAVGVLVSGNVLFQFPMGWLADRFPRRLLMAACVVATILGAALLPWAVGHPLLLWPLLFLWGAVAFGIYPVIMAELGDRFTGAMLLAGNAGFAVMWGVGGMIGAPVAGGLMEQIGPNGLPLTLAAFYGAFLVMLCLPKKSLQ